ncbi:ribosomal protection-like ABC-F family protein [Macrococcus sp. DPC7161]|uniref:ribosomal protection-like ABC-F family protein n=1 Tax=Macrococcus sp. DPC7161 TaxID=2507060 RepID=UPI00100A3D30|nr:ABC-F family ATP-binding cassette domain-containing protein [Macrococcus sp. DPC7161]RXK17833.1 ABC-F family ATP-binding cassette domain-containing protein [Macrococcus sp. DPC7161]
MLKLNKTNINAGDKRLFNDLTFVIDTHKHVALIGNNGIGKTTLLKTLLTQDHNIGILEQTLPKTTDNVLDYILSSRETLYQIKKKMNEDYTYIEAYIEQDGYQIEQEIITMMKRFGFSETDADRSIQTLSGGEQTKIALIKLLISGKTTLLFDEPTNHLDIETKQWLIQWMNQSDHTILYATHDRDFINQTAHEILELTHDGIRKFEMNYDQYKIQKDLEHKTNQERIHKEQKEKKRMKAMIQNMKEWHHTMDQNTSNRNPDEQKKMARLAKRMKTKTHQLEQKIEKFEGKIEKEKRTDYNLNHENINKNHLITVNQLNFQYDDKTIFNNVTFQIKPKERIHLKGKNGSGKSTLLKLILGDYGEQQSIQQIPNLKIGYFSQQLENLNPERTVLEEVQETLIDTSKLRTILASFRFTESQMNQLVKDLSMGEKCRLSFVKLYFTPAHILILDEPTNYFDIEMQDILINMLNRFESAILFVSHDDYFSNQIKTRTLTIQDKTIIDSAVSIDKTIDAEQLNQQIQQIDKLE